MTTTATLSAMIPVTIDDTTLTSTTVSEADHAAYNGATTYALGDRVISAATHRIYESARASNTGNDPDDIDNRVSTSAGDAWWIDVSATNAWKMFDGEKSSGTVEANTLTVVLKPGFVNSLYVGGISNCDTAVVTMVDRSGGTEVYNETITLENSFPPDYYEYFFSGFSQQTDFVLDDIPPYLNGQITVIFTVSSGNIEIGMLQVGDLRPIGITQIEAEIFPKSYSSITIDDFGNNKIVRRKKARDMSLTTLTEIDYADTAIQLLTDVIDTPVVWIATTASKYASLRVFGLGNGKMKYLTDKYATIDIEIRGLI